MTRNHSFKASFKESKKASNDNNNNNNDNKIARQGLPQFQEWLAKCQRYFCELFRIDDETT